MCSSKSARRWLQSMKYGPASAAVSATISRMREASQNITQGERHPLDRKSGFTIADFMAAG